MTQTFGGSAAGVDTITRTFRDIDFADGGVVRVYKVAGVRPDHGVCEDD
jgi:hypothetical protein